MVVKRIDVPSQILANAAKQSASRLMRVFYEYRKPRPRSMRAPICAEFGLRRSRLFRTRHSLAINEKGLRATFGTGLMTCRSTAFFVAGKQGEFFSLSIPDRKRLMEIASMRSAIVLRRSCPHPTEHGRNTGTREARAKHRR